MSPNTKIVEGNASEVDDPPPHCYPNVVFDAVRTAVEVLCAIAESTLQSVLALLWFLPYRLKSIRNDVVLITGGGKGLGRFLAVEFAKHKPKQIILWGRHDDTMASTCNVVSRMGTPCDYMICDVSERTQIFKKAEVVKQKFGKVTILVNNAGVLFGNPVLESSPSEIEHTMNVNVMAHFWTTQAFLPEMLMINHGHLVFINSMMGLMGLTGITDYSTSKFASTGFCENLQLEIVKACKSGVKVTTVHPGHVMTDMFAGCTHRFPPLMPSLDPHYVAWKAVDSTLNNQTYIIIPRILYIVYLLKSLLPVRAMVAVNRFFGVDRTMDSFHSKTIKKCS